MRAKFARVAPGSRTIKDPSPRSAPGTNGRLHVACISQAASETAQIAFVHSIHSSIVAWNAVSYFCKQICRSYSPLALADLFVIQLERCTPIKSIMRRRVLMQQDRDRDGSNWWTGGARANRKWWTLVCCEVLFLRLFEQESKFWFAWEFDGDGNKNDPLWSLLWWPSLNGGKHRFKLLRDL